MHSSFDFKNCAALITGASSGLGAEFARQLAPDARVLWLTARRAEALGTVREELLQINPALQIHIHACDISADAGREGLIRAVSASDDKPNLLINNAGAGDYGGFASGEAARIRGQIDLNITALVMLTHALLPMMPRCSEHPAAILNVGSLAGNIPMPDLAVYAATKSMGRTTEAPIALEGYDAMLVPMPKRFAIAITESAPSLSQMFVLDPPVTSVAWRSLDVFRKMSVRLSQTLPGLLLPPSSVSTRPRPEVALARRMLPFVTRTVALSPSGPG